jgi:succinate dehydrogenase/fumarate reductase flavoprotein subunit
MALLRGICMDQKVQFCKPIQIVKLLTADGKGIGAAGVNCSTAAFNVFWAKAVVLAAGGGSAIHRLSTYPPGLVGSGYRLAYDAGAELTDMEFLQYEPCCFIYPDTVRGRLAVTTLLFEGGELRNKDGEPFVRKFSPGGYHIQKYLLARLIMQEIAAGRGSKHGGVFYDVTSVAQSRVKTDNAIFYEPALTGGVDMLKEYAEVAPVAHTFLGGVVIDSSCATAAAGLFAAGEVAGGVHGANRIGGCSGADTLVFAGIVAVRLRPLQAGANFVATAALAEAELWI